MTAGPESARVVQTLRFTLFDDKWQSLPLGEAGAGPPPLVRRFPRPFIASPAVQIGGGAQWYQTAQQEPMYPSIQWKYLTEL